MIKHRLLFSLSSLALLLFLPTALAQAPAPLPPGPTNVTKILEKAGQFTTFIRLLQITQTADRLNVQLNNSNQGMTIFAPSDSAFSSLPSGSLNSLSDQRKSELVQFHIISSFLSPSQFQTVSNPISTTAGSSSSYQFPLNITTSGSQANITTGVVNATVANTIYTDNQLAVYAVDKVLLPMAIFGPQPPAPAPAPPGPNKKTKSAGSSAGDAPADASGAITLTLHGIVVSVGAAVFVASVNHVL